MKVRQKINKINIGEKEDEIVVANVLWLLALIINNDNVPRINKIRSVLSFFLVHLLPI